MSGSLRLGTFLGIPVDIHWTFFLLFIWVGYAGAGSVLGWQAFLMESGLILALFFCVVLHEFGHALTARRFGVETRDIILSPIGGVARLETLPQKPIQEFYIAIAGPLVNVAIALILSPYLLFFNFEKLYHFSANELLTSFSFFIPWLILTNILLAVFNLIPAFPMDGGRVFRALLAIKFGRLKATKVASLTGQALSILIFAMSAYYGAMVPALIGIFIFAMATQEYRTVYTDEMLKKGTVREVFRSEFSLLSEDDPMRKAIEKIHPPESINESNFLVLNANGQLCCQLEREQILKAIKENAEDRPISDYVTRKTPLVSPDETLSQAWNKLGQTSASIAGVWEMGEIIGIIDKKIIEEYLQLQEAATIGKRSLLSFKSAARKHNQEDSQSI